MPSPDFRQSFRLLADYNRWMNDALYRACTGLTDPERKRDLGVSFGSIHGTLNHLLYGDRAWMGRFTGEPFAVTTIGEELYTDFDALWRERQVTDAQIVAWVETLSAEWLRADFTYTSNVDRLQRVLPAWVLVTHLFNHQTHHRGQVSVLLQQLGCEPPITDIPWLPSLHAVVDTAERGIP